MGQGPTSNDSWILFGMKGPNLALKLEQIEIKITTDDDIFYGELRKYYRLSQGRFRYWFSILEARMLRGCQGKA